MEDNKLISGIISQAEDEAERIVLDAQKTADLKLRALESDIERIRKETDNKISLKLDEIGKRTKSAVQSEKRRQFLRSMERINKEIDRLFHEKIKSRPGSPEYDDFLAKLIAEGALAVNDDRVEVSCSFKEKITVETLEKASRYIRDSIGRDIKLMLSEGNPLSKQGILVKSSSGRISYNNQIDARLRRFEEDIKMIIANGLRKE